MSLSKRVGRVAEAEEGLEQLLAAVLGALKDAKYVVEG
jgi:hypothetical protein